MSQENKPLNFIEQIIEENIKNGFQKENLLFRFPPEPNGYLHIGHAKSICLNFGLGLKYNAPVNLRFDDTNPAKEEQEYVDAIKNDIKWLGFNWNKECYSSDYFQQLYDWAIEMIKNGKAYVDSQSSEEIAIQKGTPSKPGINSPYRDRTIKENLELFQEMKNGSFEEGTHVLRAKIDMFSPNILMRDPIMYRILDKHHHRTKNDWKIYPMYDYAHGQGDYIEEISHSICTLEFVMHRELYNWFLDQIYQNKKIRPNQYEFARLNLSYTIMSKRKLLQLVEEKHVNGWDDPRMPTISGLRRRGYTPESIRKFCETIGVAKRENIIDVSLLEFCLRDELNKTAKRVMAVIDPIKITITNYKENIQWLEAENNQEDITEGYRKIPFSKELYIEREDFEENPPEKYLRLTIGNEVRLKNAYIIKAEKIIKNKEGIITEILVTYDKDSLSGSRTEASTRKVSATIHWVSLSHAVQAEIRLYDRLFIDETPDSYKQKSFLEFINPKSIAITKGFLEPSLKTAKKGDKFQFQRIGYFNVDDESTENNLIFNKIVGLKDTWGEKSKTETNILINTQKEINKYLKENNEETRKIILKTIIKNIKGIQNYNLLQQSVIKNIKNDINSLLFSNFILNFSRNICFKDIEKEYLTKLYSMSIKTNSIDLKIAAIQNIKKDEKNYNNYKQQLTEMMNKEKNENIIEILKGL